MRPLTLTDVWSLVSERGGRFQQHWVQTTLESINYMCVFCLLIELGIQLIADFRRFWQNWWNILNICFFIVVRRYDGTGKFCRRWVEVWLEIMRL